MFRQQNRARPDTFAASSTRPYVRAFTDRGRLGSPTSWSSISGPQDVLVPIPSSPDLSYSLSSSPLPASSSPPRLPPLRMHSPDLPPSSPIASSPRTFWHVALCDGPGVPQCKAPFKEYSHVAPSLSPTDSTFSRDEGGDFFLSMKAHRRSSSETAPTLVSDVDPSEFSDDNDMIDDFSILHHSEASSSIQNVKIQSSEVISERPSESGIQVHSLHSQHAEEDKHKSSSAVDYDVAIALLDLRRGVGIPTSRHWLSGLSRLSSTGPDCPAKLPQGPSSQMVTCNTLLPSSALHCDRLEDVEEMSEKKSGVRTGAGATKDSPLSSESESHTVEIPCLVVNMVGDDVEIPMPMPDLSSTASNHTLDPREQVVSELFRAPSSESLPQKVSDSIVSMPENWSPLIELSSACLSDNVNSDSDAIGDCKQTLDTDSSSQVNCSDINIETFTHELSIGDTLPKEAAYCARNPASSALTIQSQDHSVPDSQVGGTAPAANSPREALATFTSVRSDISIVAPRLLAVSEKTFESSVDSVRKGKEKFRDNENSERHLNSNKKRRRQAVTVLSESSIMNSRSSSPTFSDANCLSPLTEDEVDMRDCLPSPKRRRLKNATIASLTEPDVHAAQHAATIAGFADSVEQESSPTITTDKSIDADAHVKAEMRGFLIQTMALSRASSMPASSLLREVLREQPQLTHQRTKDEWLSVIEDTLGNAPVFGRVDRIGTDAADQPLEAQWFYIPEKDEDQDRAALLREMMPKKRKATKSHKQYYYRPLGKLSRWEAEEDA